MLFALEGLRKSKLIGSAQEASVRLQVDPRTASQLDPELLATLFIVSSVEIVPGEQFTRPSSPAREISSRQVRAMLELSTERRPESRATDTLRPLCPCRLWTSLISGSMIAT